MTNLPANPDFEQIRFQAKDILKAHRTKNSSCCKVLRNLVRFSDVSDSAILASEIKLQEVQFALAMEYGFETWRDLKEVVSSRASSSTATIQREGAKTWLAGVPALNCRNEAGCVPPGQTSVIAALSRCLETAGEKTSYELLMGLSSHAFRFQFDWCPSAPHAFCGFNTADPAVRAYGYSLTQHSTARPSHREDLDEPDELSPAFRAAMLSIEMGIPGLMDWEESSVLCGYERPEKGIAGLLGPGGKSIEKLPWSVGILNKESTTPQRRDSISWSLKTAIQNAHATTLSGFSFAENQVMTYPAGLAAWRKWIGELNEAPEGFDYKEAQLGNAWTYECLLDARRSAAVYLNGLISECAEAAQELAASAEHYRTVGDILEDGWAARNVWEEEPERWAAKETRHRQAATLQNAMNSEEKAVGALAAVVERLEGSASS
mgnify:CR=1 FL=1|jgi:hypothetical protein|tara:strand:- start:1878 stop:3179 length:1302 start_codon:yes stop_codon:yes gene_type:complete